MTVQIEVEMELSKETKGTYVYASEGDVIPTLYIRKGSFDGPPPKAIVVKIEALS